MSDQWLLGLLRKFPVFDPSWPAETQERWFRTFWRLLAKGRTR